MAPSDIFPQSVEPASARGSVTCRMRPTPKSASSSPTSANCARCSTRSARSMPNFCAAARVSTRWTRPSLIAACGGAVCWREGKEPRTTPGGAGDGAGDGGQARISRALPVEAIGDDGDDVALALLVILDYRKRGPNTYTYVAGVHRPPLVLNLYRYADG